jgi:hypothetical protein
MGLGSPGTRVHVDRSVPECIRQCRGLPQWGPEGAIKLSPLFSTRPRARGRRDNSSLIRLPSIRISPFIAAHSDEGLPRNAQFML